MHSSRDKSQSSSRNRKPLVPQVSITAGCATSPIAAMNMDGQENGNAVLPTIVTLTLTTVLWPGTAH